MFHRNLSFSLTNSKFFSLIDALDVQLETFAKQHLYKHLYKIIAEYIDCLSCKNSRVSISLVVFSFYEQKECVMFYEYTWHRIETRDHAYR